MAISFHEESDTGFNYATVDNATLRLRNFGATALDKYSQHDHEKRTGGNLDDGDTAHGNLLSLAIEYRLYCAIVDRAILN
jgi:hypothetical protein